MVFGYITPDKEKLIVYTELKELGYRKGRGGNWWALKAFDALRDDAQDLSTNYEGKNGHLKKWVFPASLELAIRRILEARKKSFYLLTQAECNQHLKTYWQTQEESKSS